MLGGPRKELSAIRRVTHHSAPRGLLPWPAGSEMSSALPFADHAGPVGDVLLLCGRPAPRPTTEPGEHPQMAHTSGSFPSAAAYADGVVGGTAAPFSWSDLESSAFARLPELQET